VLKQKISDFPLESTLFPVYNGGEIGAFLHPLSDRDGVKTDAERAIASRLRRGKHAHRRHQTIRCCGTRAWLGFRIPTNENNFQRMQVLSLEEFVVVNLCVHIHDSSPLLVALFERLRLGTFLAREALKFRQFDGLSCSAEWVTSRDF
jgi:hypothetical protein